MLQPKKGEYTVILCSAVLILNHSEWRLCEDETCSARRITKEARVEVIQPSHTVFIECTNENAGTFTLRFCNSVLVTFTIL